MKNEADYCNYIEKKVLAFCRQQGMFTPKEKVLLGVSGGADSVCLLVVLSALKKELELELHVAHMNHGVRKEAELDCAYVEGLCRKFDVPFSQKTIDMNALAAQWKCSCEEAGRNARYVFFEELAEEMGAGKIAVAHHMGDSAETMLFNLFRGSGLAGLSGIRPVRGKVVRPLLCLERSEIEEYLGRKEIAYCHDRTNDGDDYTRNRIRHHILPYAEQEIARGATRNVYEATRHIAQTQDFVEQQVEAVWKDVLLSNEETCIQLDIEALTGLHIVLQKGILRRAVGFLARGCRDITKEHIEGLLSLIQGSGNRQICLPYQLRGERSYERLLIYVESSDREPKREIIVDVTVLGAEPTSYLFDGWDISFCVLPFTGNPQDIPQNQYTKWFDYDKIKGSLEIRNRQNGDYFSLRTGDGMGRKKLKDYFMDEKIPRKMRDEFLLIAEESHVLWMVSQRISEYFKVDGETQKILQISAKDNGGTYGKA
ncbi:MAG: tRNA lysidine(34) synthetase TilS [Lachnospiraceae bacterium]|nr:tRNA lysidine(34) synthetase TilS [Lachnospiraceae bacterium]